MCLQIYEVYFFNIYLSSNRNSLSALGEFIKLRIDLLYFRPAYPIILY